MSFFEQYADLKNYTVERTTDFTNDYIDYIIRLCKPYSEQGKINRENYSAETLYRLFKTGRFIHGFFVVKHCSKVVLTFGIDDFKGWAVGTRYLQHLDTPKAPFLPLASGIASPYVKQHLGSKVIGLCTTHNVTTRSIFPARRRFERYTGNNLFGVAAGEVKLMKEIEYPILYRGTVQKVVTCWGTDLIPPFERATLPLNP
jgi:hypothetical protein